MTTASFARHGIRDCLTVIDPSKLTTASTRFRSFPGSRHCSGGGHSLGLAKGTRDQDLPFRSAQFLKQENKRLVGTPPSRAKVPSRRFGSLRYPYEFGRDHVPLLGRKQSIRRRHRIKRLAAGLPFEVTISIMKCVTGHLSSCPSNIEIALAVWKRVLSLGN